MRRLLILTGVCGLLALSWTAVLAKAPQRANLRSYTANPTAAPCSEPAGSSAGQVQLVKRGMVLGGLQYTVQLQLSAGASSTTYDVLAYARVPHEDPSTQGTSTICEQVADLGALQTNRKGKGAATLAYVATRPNASERLWIVVRDTAASPSADIGTGSMLVPRS
jgi:hypothetical protein